MNATCACGAAARNVPVGLDAVPWLDPDDLGAQVARRDRVELVGRAVHERDAAGTEPERGDEQDDLVAAGADDDLLDVDADEPRDRLLERAVRRIGVVVRRQRREARDGRQVPGRRLRRGVHVEAVERPVGQALLPAVGRAPCHARPDALCEIAHPAP